MIKLNKITDLAKYGRVYRDEYGSLEILLKNFEPAFEDVSGKWKAYRNNDFMLNPVLIVSGEGELIGNDILNIYKSHIIDTCTICENIMNNTDNSYTMIQISNIYRILYTDLFDKIDIDIVRVGE
jgi:hypothetical protein